MPTTIRKKNPDLKKILKRHRAFDNVAEAVEALHGQERRISRTAKHFNDDDDREAARLSEMENILIEAEVIEEPKRFHPPEVECDLDFLDGITAGVEDEFSEADFSDDLDAEDRDE